MLGMREGFLLHDHVAVDPKYCVEMFLVQERECIHCIITGCILLFCVGIPDGGCCPSCEIIDIQSFLHEDLITNN